MEGPSTLSPGSCFPVYKLDIQAHVVMGLVYLFDIVFKWTQKKGLAPSTLDLFQQNVASKWWF